MVRKDKNTFLHLQQAIHYVQHGTYAESVTPEEKSGIRKLAASFVVDGNQVYYCGPKNDPNSPAPQKRLVLTSEEEVKRVLQEAHDNSSHQGTRRTQEKIKQQYYWLSITNDVKDWIKNCPTCHSCKKRNHLPPEFPPIKVEGRWEVLSVGLIGPLRETADGNKYIITMTDMFTKWVVAHPLRDKSGASAAMAIINMIHTYGPPLNIITNLGREFVNEVNKNMPALFSIKEIMTSSHHPQINGQVKATNRIVRAAVYKSCNANQDDWDQVLGSAVYGINTSRHTTTNYTPFYLMYLRQARPPIFINTLNDSRDDMGFEQDCNTEILIADAIETCVDVNRTVAENIERAQKRIKVEHTEEDDKVTFIISVGDEAKRHNESKENIRNNIKIHHE